MDKDDRRRFVRRTIGARARMRARKDRAVGVRVDDISQAGIRFECPFPLEIGQEVAVDVPNIGGKRAFVAWRRGPTHGCQFTVPLRHQDVARAFTELELVKVKWSPPVSFSGAYAVLSALLLIPLTLLGASILMGRG